MFRGNSWSLNSIDSPDPHLAQRRRGRWSIVAWSPQLQLDGWGPCPSPTPSTSCLAISSATTAALNGVGPIKTQMDTMLSGREVNSDVCEHFWFLEKLSINPSHTWVRADPHTAKSEFSWSLYGSFFFVLLFLMLWGMFQALHQAVGCLLHQLLLHSTLYFSVNIVMGSFSIFYNKDAFVFSFSFFLFFLRWECRDKEFSLFFLKHVQIDLGLFFICSPILHN